MFVIPNSMHFSWKRSIQPLAYCSAPLTQFSGLASQKWVWVSSTKYFSPSFSYIRAPYLDGLQVVADDSPRGCSRRALPSAALRRRLLEHLAAGDLQRLGEQRADRQVGERRRDRAAQEAEVDATRHVGQRTDVERRVRAQ